MAVDSPFATSFRQDLSSMQENPQFMGGIGSMLQQYRAQLGGGQAQNTGSMMGQGEVPSRQLNPYDPREYNYMAQPQVQREVPSYLTQGRANTLFNQLTDQSARPPNPFAGITPEYTTGNVSPTNFGPDTALFTTNQGPENAAQPALLPSARPEPVNPFADNEQYQAMMEYQKSMQPQQEQMDRMNELQTAFEGTGGYKDYRISQMEQQLQQRQRQNPRMGMGLGGMRPTGMGMYGGMPRPQQNVYGGQRGFGGNPNNYGGGQQGGYGMPQMPQRNPYQQGGYGQQQGGYGMQGGYGQQPQNQYQQNQYQQPQQQYQSPYQQPRPQPQQFGGYGMGQSSQGGYGGYGGMSNAYAPQQYGQQSMGQPQQFASYMR